MAKKTRNTPPTAASPSRKSNAGKKTDATRTDAAKTLPVMPAGKDPSPGAAAVSSTPVEATAKTGSAPPATCPIQSAIAFPALPGGGLAELSAREVVFTIDGWKSLQVLRSSEAPDAFHPDHVLLTGVAAGTEVEFAVHLRFGSQGLWLNNGGGNYRQITGWQDGFESAGDKRGPREHLSR